MARRRALGSISSRSEREESGTTDAGAGGAGGDFWRAGPGDAGRDACCELSSPSPPLSPLGDICSGGSSYGCGHSDSGGCGEGGGSSRGDAADDSEEETEGALNLPAPPPALARAAVLAAPAQAGDERRPAAVQQR